MDAAEVFVLADTFQYSRQSFQNRSRLRTPDGWQWISIPLEGRRHGQPILSVEIRGRHRWIAKHWRALLFNYRTTPYFGFHEHRLQPLFETEWDRLADLTIATIELVRDLLGISTPLVRASQLPKAPSDLKSILRRVGNEGLLVPRESLGADLSLASTVMEFDHPWYRQNFQGFEPEMSALDLLFNYGLDSLPIIRNQTRFVEVSSTT